MVNTAVWCTLRIVISVENLPKASLSMVMEKIFKSAFIFCLNKDSYLMFIYETGFFNHYRAWSISSPVYIVTNLKYAAM